MPVLTTLQPPGKLTDLDAAGLAAWRSKISDLLDQAGSPPARSLFVNPLTHDIPADAATKRIDWIAFPLLVQNGPGSQRAKWEAADGDRDLQDEYCEWSVQRDQDGIIRSVAFTSEPPDYWLFLAERDPNLVLDLYRQHVNPAVAPGDLFPNGVDYEPRNTWNNSTERGVMHLIQPNNTLEAEIELAAAATIARRKNGAPVISEGALISCSRYGAAGRNSDPHIGGEVNEVARLGADVSLADPVGLHIDRLNTAGWLAPDGTDAQTFWTITRGSPAFAVRGVFEVPKAKGYRVGDIEIDGAKIEFGSQIAERLSIRITGVGCHADATRATTHPCRSAGGPAIAPDQADIPSGLESRR
jgi:hypothetical protein